MLRVGTFGLILLFLTSDFTQAQSPATQPAPARAGAAVPRGGRGGAQATSPEVNSAEHTFTVRYRAANAKEVVVVGEIDGKDHPMTKGDNGIWTVKIGPLPPDVYNYQIKVDGVIA